VAVVLTLVQTKQIRISIHKRNNTKNIVQTIQNTVNTSTHVTKTPTHYKTQTYIHTHFTKQVKTTAVQVKTKKVHDIRKLNSHSKIKYPQYKVTLMYMALLSSSFTVTHFTLLQNKVTSHKSRQFTTHHHTSHHFTYLHSIPT